MSSPSLEAALQYALAVESPVIRKRLVAFIEAQPETVTCPDCGFRYGREHHQADGTYACPLCEVSALEAENEELREYKRQAHQLIRELEAGGDDLRAENERLREGRDNALDELNEAAVVLNRLPYGGDLIRGMNHIDAARRALNLEADDG